MTECMRCRCETDTLHDTVRGRLCSHCRARHVDLGRTLPEVFVPESGGGEVFHVPTADPGLNARTLCGVDTRRRVSVAPASLPTAIRHGHHRLCRHCVAALDPQGQRTPSGENRGPLPEVGPDDLPPGLSPDISKKIEEIRDQREGTADD